LGFETFQGWAAFEEAEHGADLPGGAAGDVEEGEEFVGGAALEAFGDVVRNGEGAAVELVALGEGDAILGFVQEILAAFGESDGFLPGGEVFEALVGHGRGI
jgi:hypothetical protein